MENVYDYFPILLICRNRIYNFFLSYNDREQWTHVKIAIYCDYGFLSVVVVVFSGFQTYSTFFGTIFYSNRMFKKYCKLQLRAIPQPNEFYVLNNFVDWQKLASHFFIYYYRHHLACYVVSSLISQQFLSPRSLTHGNSPTPCLPATINFVAGFHQNTATKSVEHFQHFWTDRVK